MRQKKQPNCIFCDFDIFILKGTTSINCQKCKRRYRFEHRAYTALRNYFPLLINNPKIKKEDVLLRKYFIKELFYFEKKYYSEKFIDNLYIKAINKYFNNLNNA